MWPCASSSLALPSSDWVTTGNKSWPTRTSIGTSLAHSSAVGGGSVVVLVVVGAAVDAVVVVDDVAGRSAMAGAVDSVVASAAPSALEPVASTPDGDSGADEHAAKARASHSKATARASFTFTARPYPTNVR